MEQVGCAHRGRDLQVDAERLQGRVHLGQPSRRRIRAHARLVARRAEAVDVDIDEWPQLAHQEFDVHPGSPVYLGGYSRVRIPTRMALTLAAPTELHDCP